MKKYSRSLISKLSIGCSVLAIAVYLFWGRNPAAPVSQPIDETPYDHYQIVLLDENDMFVPFTVRVKKGDLTQTWNQLLELMKTTQQATSLFRGFLDSDLALHKAKLNQDTLDLDFNSSFLNYEKQHELKILEAMVFIAHQFGGTKVNLLVDHFQLQYMPMKNTVVAQPLTRKIGINNFMNEADHIQRSSPITIFYEKKIHGQRYLVPQTKRINHSKITMDLLLEELLDRVFVSSLLEQPLHSKDVSFAKPPLIEQDRLTLYFEESILEEERTINDLYIQLLLLSIKANSSIKKVKIMVGDDTVGLGGMNEEFIDVGSILYNYLSTTSN